MWAVLTAILAVAVIACIVYVNHYYHADEEAIAAFAPVNTVTEQVLGDGLIAYMPEDPDAGFIFYPGGKVEYSAYVPLMKACAEEGILCILVEMPFNLAVLDIEAASDIRGEYPDIEEWYIGGHSLGGSVAAVYLSDHMDEYEGLVLLGSYSSENLSGGELAVLSVYGSEDNVLNRQKYADNLANLPTDFVEVVIDGGCHAYFGMYGPQAGDGVPSISNEEQIVITADCISDFILG